MYHNYVSYENIINALLSIDSYDYMQNHKLNFVVINKATN